MISSFVFNLVSLYWFGLINCTHTLDVLSKRMKVPYQKRVELRGLHAQLRPALADAQLHRTGRTSFRRGRHLAHNPADGKTTQAL